jgi:deoxycytidylate deaminase
VTRVPCLKRAVRCVIVRDDGRRFEGRNLCEVSGLTACPRADLPTGERYDLCRPAHAECEAAVLAFDSQESPGTAYLYGHEYFCQNCQRVLTRINVRTLVIMPEGSP